MVTSVDVAGPPRGRRLKEHDMSIGHWLKPAAFAAMAALSACAGQTPGPAKLSQSEQADLDKALAGKVAGEKQACINHFGTVNMRAISDEVLLYTASSKQVYVNHTIGVCRGLTMGGTLVLRTFGSQYCRGDMAHVVDLVTGIQHGACALGDFTPYTSAEPPK
jgi:hypothetical protein